MNLAFLRNISFLMIGVSLLVAAYSYSQKSDFQVVQLGEMARNQFLLDKNSGRIWQKVCMGETKGPDCNGLLIWDEMYVDELTDPYSRAARVHEFVQKEMRDAETKKNSVKDKPSK